MYSPFVADVRGAYYHWRVSLGRGISRIFPAIAPVLLALLLLVAVGVAFRQTRSASEDLGTGDPQSQSATAVTTMDSDPTPPASEPSAPGPDSDRLVDVPRFELTVNGSSSVFLHPDVWRPGGSWDMEGQRGADPHLPRWADTGEPLRIVVWDGATVHEEPEALDLLASHIAADRWDRFIDNETLDIPPFVLQEAREAVTEGPADHVYARGEGRYLFNRGPQWYALLLYLRDGSVVDVELRRDLNTGDPRADTDSDVFSAR